MIKSFSSDFDPAFAYVINNERGFVDDPKDPGGVTNFGISVRYAADYASDYPFLDEMNLEASIESLTVENAKLIYRGEYWNELYSQIIGQDICNFVFDCAFSIGPAMAHRFAQRSCWSCGIPRSELVDDGVIGIKTIKAINFSIEKILPALRSERSNYYRLKIVQDPNKKRFEEGWLNRTYA